MRLPLLLCVVSLSSLSLRADAPVSLTASDGTGLKLVKLQARGVVMDPLAFTELTLTFENPLDRVLEGQFKVTLPAGATVSRFAMKLDDRWQEGEVVERQAARRAYEDFLHRRQDPALLEQSGGNEFTAKVFPIPARGMKEVVLSYSHELVASTADYVLPLKGLPEVGELDVKVSGVTGEGVLARSATCPTRTSWPRPKRNQLGVRSGDLVAARVDARRQHRRRPGDRADRAGRLQRLARAGLAGAGGAGAAAPRGAGQARPSRRSTWWPSTRRWRRSTPGRRQASARPRPSSCGPAGRWARRTWSSR